MNDEIYDYGEAEIDVWLDYNCEKHVFCGNFEKIEDLYRRVIDFIKWFNEQNK